MLYLCHPREVNRYFDDTQMHRTILVGFAFPHLFTTLFWIISMARWPCPRTVFFLQTAFAVQFWFIAATLTRRGVNSSSTRLRRASYGARVLASAKHAWRRLNAPVMLPVRDATDDADAGVSLLFTRHAPAMERVATKGFVGHALANTVVFLAASVDYSTSDAREPWGFFASPMPPRWPWTPVQAVYTAASEGLPRMTLAAMAFLGDKGVRSALTSGASRVVWCTATACAGASGWVFAWVQQRKFARVLDPTLHVKCCGGVHFLTRPHSPPAFPS